MFMESQENKSEKFKIFSKKLAVWLFVIVQIELVLLNGKDIIQYFDKGNIIIQEPEFIALTFTAKGPSILIKGQFDAIDKEQLITNIKITVKDIEMKNTYYYNPEFFVQSSPLSFKELIRNKVSETETKIAPFHPFNINPSSSVRYYIKFIDTSANSKLWPKLKLINEEYNNKLINKYYSEDYNSKDIDKNIEFMENSYKELNIDEYEKELIGSYNWIPGKYIITMHITTSNNNKILPKSWTFDISEKGNIHLFKTLPMVIKNYIMELNRPITQWMIYDLKPIN